MRSLFETPPEHALIDFFQLLGSMWGPFGTTFSTLFSMSINTMFFHHFEEPEEPVLASEREAREFNEVLSTFAYLSQQSEELPDPPPHWEMEYIWFPTQPPTRKLNTFDFPPTPHWEMEYI